MRKHEKIFFSETTRPRAMMFGMSKTAETARPRALLFGM